MAKKDLELIRTHGVTTIMKVTLQKQQVRTASAGERYIQEEQERCASAGHIRFNFGCLNYCGGEI